MRSSGALDRSWPTAAVSTLTILALAWVVVQALSTAQVSGQGGPITRLAVIGDYGDSGQPEADVAALVHSWGVDLVATVGDNNYDDGLAATIDANIGQYYQSFIKPYNGTYGPGSPDVNRFFPALGNHDWRALSCAGGNCTGPYFDYFELPGNERYYSQAWGPVEIFIIDSDPNEPDGRSSGSIQGLWLQAALAASTSPWKLVFMHHSPYSSAENHGSDPDMQWPYAAWGASAVFGGHDHIYERLEVDGIPYFVNGTGGRPTLYPFSDPLTESQVRYNAQHGAMRVDASATGIRFEFIARDGTSVDVLTLGSDAPTPLPTFTPPPPTPSPTPAALGISCFAVADEGDPDRLFERDAVTGIWQALDTLAYSDDSAVDGVEAIAYDAFEGLIYAVDDDVLGLVDPETSVFSPVAPADPKTIGTADGAVGEMTIDDIDGLSVHPFTGALWASERRSTEGSADAIVILDPATGKVVPDAFGPGIDYILAEMVFDPIADANTEDLDDIAWSPASAELFAISNAGSNGGLLTVLDPSSGALVRNAGNFGLVDDMEGLAFHNDSSLLGATGSNGSLLNRVYAIDPESAAPADAGVVDPTGAEDDVEAIACLTEAPNRIEGRVFHDIDADGFFGPGDVGTSDLTVRLYRESGDAAGLDAADPLLADAEVDAEGRYDFEFAANGDFLVVLDPAALSVSNAWTTPSSFLVPFVGHGEVADGVDMGHAATSVTLEKTLYHGHDAGASCPGTDYIVAPEGSAITYCFEFQNTGETLLDDVVVFDANLGIDRSGLSLRSGIEPVAPNERLVFYREEVVSGDLLNIALASGVPVSDQGEILPILEAPADTDVANLEASPADGLCVGNRVFFDQDNDGVFEPAAGEFGLDRVSLRAYHDDGSLPGELDPSDTVIETGESATEGRYRFCGLFDGDYMVEVLPENFEAGGTLEGLLSSAGNDVFGQPPDPNDDVDHDDNGGEVVGFGVVTAPISLSEGGEPDIAEDGDGTNSNQTLDLGFTRQEEPTGVALSELAALREGPRSIRLRWRTSQEQALVGFHVWRLDSIRGWARVSEALILAEEARQGALYAWIDASAPAGRVYYRLVLVRADGSEWRSAPSFVPPIAQLPLFLPRLGSTGW